MQKVTVIYLEKEDIFSDLYDGYNHDYEKVQEEFCSFLIKNFPQLAYLINYRIFCDSNRAEKFVEAVGVESLLSAFNEYNEAFLVEYNMKYQQYVEDRRTITPEISIIFKQTVQFIDKFYRDDMELTLSMSAMYEFRELVRRFFHSDSVESQLLAANKICEMFNINIEFNSDSFSI